MAFRARYVHHCFRRTPRPQQAPGSQYPTQPLAKLQNQHSNHTLQLPLAEPLAQAA